MTREEAKSCIGTVELLQRLAYNIHGVMDVIDADNCKKIIKALEQEPTTKNDLGVDYISKQEVVGLMMHIWGKNHSGDDAMQECIDAIREMPSVTPQEPKPMVEIDLDYVIKQKYIEREVLDKIIAEIKALSPEPTAYDVVDGNPIKDAVWETLTDVLQIIDKYKAENEG